MILAASCANIEKSTTIHVTKVTESGIDDKSGDFCSEFSLTKDEAQLFFIKSRIVSVKEIHDEYPVLPCFVACQGKLNKESCSLNIRAGGTGHISCKSQSFLTACDDCLPKPL